MFSSSTSDEPMDCTEDEDYAQPREGKKKRYIGGPTRTQPARQTAHRRRPARSIDTTPPKGRRYTKKRSTPRKTDPHKRLPNIHDIINVDRIIDQQVEASKLTAALLNCGHYESDYDSGLDCHDYQYDNGLYAPGSVDDTAPSAFLIDAHAQGHQPDAGDHEPGPSCSDVAGDETLGMKGYFDQVKAEKAEADKPYTPGVRFRFDPTSFPKPNSRFVIPILDDEGESVDGRCERFFKVQGRYDRLFRPILRCLNCLRKHRESEKKGAAVLEPMRQWAYLPVPGGEEGEYEFIDNPFERHGDECGGNKIKLGEVAVRYTVSNALYDYQQDPTGRPLEPFLQALKRVPDVVDDRFPLAHEDHWRMAMPQWQSVNSAWTKCRRELLPLIDFDDMDNLPPIYKYTALGRRRRSPHYGEEFIIEACSATNYVFAMSDSAARSALKCTHFIVDGTFRAVKSVPNCQQLFTVHGRTLSGEVVPLGWFLLPSKDTAMYVRAFTDLKKKLKKVNGGSDDLGALKILLADWEHALDEAVRQCFPTLLRKFCAFHFAQSVIRGVARCGLIVAYRQGDDIVRSYVHEVLGAMLVPPTLINDFADQMEIVPDHDDADTRMLLRNFKNYVCKEYFRNEEHRHWLDHFTTELGWPRTSNAAEGYHSGLYEALRMQGSDLRRLLFLLNDIEYHANYRRFQLENRKKPRAKKDVYVQLDLRIDYVKSKIIGILDAIDDYDTRMVRLRRYARFCAHLLGGATHEKLVGKVTDDVEEAMDKLDKTPQPEHLNTSNIDPSTLIVGDLDLVPYEEVFAYEDESDEF